MPSGPPLNFSNFSGGLNLLDAPDLIGDHEARDLLNVQGTTAGAIVKRNGLRQVAAPASPMSSLFPFEMSGGGRFLIAADSSSLYSITDFGATTTLATGLAPGNWECVNAPAVGAQGPLYMMNAFDPPRQWNGVAGSAAAWTATDAGGVVPNGQFCVYAQNQVFVAGVTAFPSRVYCSALKDPTGWNPANLAGAGALDFDPGDGQAISGLGVVGPYILVGKPQKLWVIIDPGGGPTLPFVRQISHDTGIAAHRSIAPSPEGTYFLTDRGVYITNGSSLKSASDKVRPLLDVIVSDRRHAAAGVYYGAHYYLSFATGPFGNNVTLDYDVTLGSWWKHGFGVNQFAVWHPVSGEPAKLYAANAQRFVDQCFTPGLYQDRGFNFPWVWRGPWQSPSFYRRRLYPSTWYRKRLRQIRIQGFGTVDYSLAKDFVDPESLIRPNVLPDTPPNGIADIFSLGVARAFSQVFSATSNTQDEVLSYTMALTERTDRWD